MDVDDPVELGEIMEAKNIKVHYYCLLTSYYTVQRGEGGILGFLIADIRKAIKLGSHKKCLFCKKTNAHCKCDQCSDHYHLLCGLQGNCLFQYSGEFKTFCPKHFNIVHKTQHYSYTGCYICLETMGEYNSVTSLTGCCSPNVWVHRRCMKEYALSAGYYLKCLWCRSPNYRDEIRLLGVFVPDRDAAWELDKSRFADLHRKYSHCEADQCLCPTGRNTNRPTRWAVKVCRSCGAWGIHVGCMAAGSSSAADNNDDGVVCSSCRDVFNRTLGLSQCQIKLPRAQKSVKPPMEPLAIFKSENLSSFTLVCEEDGVERRVKCPVKPSRKFDDDLIHQLVREELNLITVIEISDSDSDKSVSELFEKMMTAKEEVPKPIIERKKI